MRTLRQGARNFERAQYHLIRRIESEEAAQGLRLQVLSELNMGALERRLVAALAEAIKGTPCRQSTRHPGQGTKAPPLSRPPTWAWTAPLRCCQISPEEQGKPSTN